MPSFFDSLRSLFNPKEKSEAARAEPPETIVTDDGMVFEVEQVKRGGMGVVYICRRAAESEEAGEDRRLALKTFDEKFFFDVDMSMTVERESTIWSRVSDQPFIFPLITTVSVGHKPYLVMPAAEPDERGVVSLADAVRRAPQGLAPDECLLLGLCLSTALDAAARSVPGLVHGDVKPDNILYIGSLPFLADFGLARLAGVGGRVGTPPYMAPELWGEGAGLSLKTDIYAFGATLFEAIAGRPPFYADGNDPAQWATLHSSRQPRFDAGGGRGMLEDGLRELALKCLAKSPSERPESFSEIKAELFALGMVTEPAVVMEVAGRIAGQRQIVESEKPRVVKMRVMTFLRQGQYAEALELLSTLPEDSLEGELLLLAGTVHSLNDQDEKALTLFERFLKTDPGPEERTRCLNEVGLSLRRLGRLEEAKELFESLLEESSGESRVRARGNYAAVLLELDDVAGGLKELEWLTRHHPKLPENWALYSLALDKSGDLAKAVGAIQQAIQRAPRNGTYYVTFAEFLLRLRRLNEAYAALEAAHGLGHHTLDWLRLTIATDLALGQTHDANLLVAQAKSQLPEEVVESVLKDATELLARVARDPESAERSEDSGAQEDAGAVDEEAEDEAGDAGEVRAEGDSDARGDQEESAERHMEAIRSGRQSHAQVRLSFVDGSFAIDFYSDVESPFYLESFKDGYQKMKWRMETMSGLAERETSYRFAKCQNCGFVILTARDEDERFECKACGVRGPVKTIRSEHLDALASECNSAVGRSEEELPGESLTLFVAFWVDKPNKAQAVAERLTAEGFEPASPEAAAFVYLQQQMEERGVETPGPLTQVWHKPITNAEGGGENTPPFLDKILRDLRRKAGALASASEVIPDAGMTEFLLSDPAGRVRIAREQAERYPHDNALKAALVAAELVAGNLEEAKRLAAVMEVTDPNDIYALKAAAEVALAERRPGDAVPRLERIIKARPRDQAARLLLINSYYELGDDPRMAEHLAQYRALGGKLPQKAED